eukprot:Skav233490  [mRNA]  locus=scaffold1310:188442:189365:+ [translate_table: standard]
MVPTDFGKTYKPSSYSPRQGVLGPVDISRDQQRSAEINRDQQRSAVAVLDFDDASHSYMLRQSQHLRAFGASVTFVASQRARDFDAAEVLRRMRNGKAGGHATRPTDTQGRPQKIAEQKTRQWKHIFQLNGHVKMETSWGVFSAENLRDDVFFIGRYTLFVLMNTRRQEPEAVRRHGHVSSTLSTQCQFAYDL